MTELQEKAFNSIKQAAVRLGLPHRKLAPDELQVWLPTSDMSINFIASPKSEDKPPHKAPDTIKVWARGNPLGTLSEDDVEYTQEARLQIWADTLIRGTFLPIILQELERKTTQGNWRIRGKGEQFFVERARTEGEAYGVEILGDEFYATKRGDAEFVTGIKKMAQSLSSLGAKSGRLKTR